MNSYRTPKGSKTIVLDRDGVINQDSSTYVKSAEEWIPISGSIDAIARLHQANFRVIIASNQSGIARGYFDEAALTRMDMTQPLRHQPTRIGSLPSVPAKQKPRQLPTSARRRSDVLLRPGAVDV